MNMHIRTGQMTVPGRGKGAGIARLAARRTRGCNRRPARASGTHAGTGHGGVLVFLLRQVTGSPDCSVCVRVVVVLPGLLATHGHARTEVSTVHLRFLA